MKKSKTKGIEKKVSKHMKTDMPTSTHKGELIVNDSKIQTIGRELSKPKNLEIQTIAKVLTKTIVDLPPDLRDQFKIQMRFQGESVVTDGKTGTVIHNAPKASITFMPDSKSTDKGR